MKRKYNTEQSAYMLAKAHLETLESIQADMEREYIFAQGIVNDNGETPEAIYCIDDEETFDRINQTFSDLPDVKLIWQEILEARDLLKAAESALIEYGLNMAPAKQRDILTRAAKTNYTTRCKIIDLVLKLDAATV